MIASAALLTVYSFLAGRRGGLGPIGSLVSAALGALLGLLVIALKASLCSAKLMRKPCSSQLPRQPDCAASLSARHRTADQA